MKHLSLLILTGLTLNAGSAWAAEVTNASMAAGVVTGQTLSRTVGIHVVSRKVNPDESLTLLYRWNDSRGRTRCGTTGDRHQGHGDRDQWPVETAFRCDGSSVARAVGRDGGAGLHERGIAGVGREKIRAAESDLTPRQAAALREVAPKPTAASDVALEKRVTDMVSDLKLNDPAKAERLHAILITDLKAVRGSHNAGFAPAKCAPGFERGVGGEPDPGTD